MKALNLSDKPKEPNHQVYNSNQQQQEYRETDTAENSQYRKSENKKETHLTTTGVCTTICPENSGM
jgi:hypothetical protein